MKNKKLQAILMTLAILLVISGFLYIGALFPHEALFFTIVTSGLIMTYSLYKIIYTHLNDEI